MSKPRHADNGTGVLMAKAISAVVCEHGALYIRLHDASGRIVAAAAMDKPTGVAFVDQVMSEFENPSSVCGGAH